MNEYSVAQNGATEFLILRRMGNDIYHVIAHTGSRDYAEQIAKSLNPAPEERLHWNDLEQIAHERGR